MRKGRIWVILGVLAIIIILVLIALPPLNLIANYPADAALKYVQAQSGGQVTVQNFTICAARQLNDGLLIQSSHIARQGQKPLIYNASYAFIKPFFWLWYADLGQTTGVSALPKYVLYGSQVLENNLIIYGQVVSPQVATIEADFEGGGQLRTLPEQGCFLITANGSQTLSGIKALDRENKVLQAYLGASSLSAR